MIKTHSDFIAEAIRIHPEYDYSETKYIDSKTPVTVICKRHGAFTPRPYNFIHGKCTGCPECGKETIKKKLTISEQVGLERLKSKCPTYDFSKFKYVNLKTKGLVLCSSGHEWLVTGKALLAGTKCPICSRESANNKQKLSIEEFITRANEIHNNTYDYTKVIYINYHTNIDIICKEHGIFKQTPAHHLSGEGCPLCNSSKGELAILKWLNQHKLVSIRQYKLPYPLNKSKTIYADFYLPDYNIIIEYNGEQHYKSIKCFGGDDKFKYQQERDQYLRDYCSGNNITLLEISYSDDIVKKLECVQCVINEGVKARWESLK